MRKLRVVARNGKIVSDLDAKQGVHPFSGKPRSTRPLAMLAVAGADARELLDFAKAEGFAVDNDAGETLIWNPKAAASDPKAQAAELMRFIIGIAESLSPTTCLTLFCLDGFDIQLENGIRDLSAGIEQAARAALANIKPREKGRLVLVHETRDLLAQAGFDLGAESATSLPITKLPTLTRPTGTGSARGGTAA